MKWIRDSLVCGFLVLILSFFMIDLLKPGLPMLHDSNPHISRMIAFHTALVDGQFPPMWAKEMLGGIGSPVMMLNYQLPYFATEGFVRLGFNYFDSYKLVLALSLVLSGVVMYLALRTKFDKLPSWLGALIYTLAPYRLVDIYVRGALGESLTFIFPPLLIWGFARSSYPILILGWAGLFLTHPTASAAFSAFFLGYILYVGEKQEIAKRLKLFFGSFGIALLIASFNLLPTLALTKYTYYSPELSDTLLMFPTLTQLFHSNWGYGVSLPGTNDGMSFELGLVQLGALLFSLLFIWNKRNSEIRYLLLSSVLCLFLILPISIPLYKMFHLTNFIDFPWRLIFCLVFAAACMGAEIVQKLKVSQSIKLVGVMIISTLLVGLTLPIAHTDKYWHRSIAWFARETGDSYGEYAPRTRATRDSAPFWKRAELVSGEGEIISLIEKSNQQKYNLKVKSDEAEVRINTTYFPGWVIPKNCYVTERTLSHIDDSGLIGCKVSKGESILEIKFEAPTVQRVGSMLTLAGIGAYLWILLASYYPHITKLRQ
jgi:hypothetical protein